VTLGQWDRFLYLSFLCHYHPTNIPYAFISPGSYITLVTDSVVKQNVSTNALFSPSWCFWLAADTPYVFRYTLPRTDCVVQCTPCTQHYGTPCCAVHILYTTLRYTLLCNAHPVHNIMIHPVVQCIPCTQHYDTLCCAVHTLYTTL